MFIPNPGEGPEGVQRRFESEQARLRGRGIDPSRFGWGAAQRPAQAASAPTPRPAVMPSQAPGRAQPQQSPYATATTYGQMPQSPAGQQGNAAGGNQAPAGQPPAVMPEPGLRPLPGSPAAAHFGGQPGNRPPAFQATTQNFDGTQSQMPNFQQRDAFISQINNQLGQMQNQSRQRPGMGPPQFNFPQMWGQAGQMAQQGFRNPFAAPAGRLVSQAALADIAPEYVGRPLPPLPPGAVY